jgi:SAM-dependent methyltransferase
MVARKGCRPYQWLAKYYDTVFDFGPALSRAARGKVLGSVLPQVESACDVACGTGTTALAPAAQGIRTHALDLSPEMCRRAREKARAAGVPIKVIQGGMRTFRLPERGDLVLCRFDALNHVPRKSDLRLVVKSVARALRLGGYFYFDVNNRPAFDTVWKLTHVIKKPGIVLVMRNGSAAAKDKAWCNLDWFLREGQMWRRRRERLEEVCWSVEEIRCALQAAGFGRIRAWDAKPLFQDDPLVQPGHRTYYLVRT